MELCPQLYTNDQTNQSSRKRKMEGARRLQTPCPHALKLDCVGVCVGACGWVSLKIAGSRILQPKP